jgi:hypothetical protein
MNTNCYCGCKVINKSAQCAKIIKKELKQIFPEIKFSVISEHHLWSSSVRIIYTSDIVDRQTVKDILKKYIEGYFDSMTDSYVSNNTREDIPQVRYIFINNRGKK